MDDQTLPSLGQWIKRRRRALDLTQEALAALVGCSKDLIVKIEGDARRPSRQIAALLADHLQLLPEERSSFVRAARAELPPDRLPPPAASVARPAFPRAPEPMPTPHDNLPAQRTSFLGRVDAVDELVRWLRQTTAHLITLTGPGGVGKTRLALEVAGIVLPDYPDGVWMVDLAPITEPEHVASAMMQALGVREIPGQQPADRLLGWLLPKQLLLLLDNYEHLVESATLVSDILRTARRVRVLVTSRVPLRLSGEHEYLVEPLDLPDPGKEYSAEQLSTYASVRLFAERACAVRPTFQITSANAGAVAEMCRRLDGLPLAVELAAARVRMFPPDVLLDRLRQALLPTLVGGVRDLPARQQTISAAIEWSYQLLTSAQQHLFARLSVFVGDWTLEAAEAVCGEEGVDVAEELQALIAHSLVHLSPGTFGPRYGMLALVREAAALQLRKLQHADETNGRFAGWCARVARVFRGQFEQGDSRLALDQIELEHTNIIAALEWIAPRVHDQPELAEVTHQIVAGCWLFWDVRHRSVLMRWLPAVLDPGWPSQPTHAYAQVLSAAWFVEPDRTSYAWSSRLTQRGLQLAELLDDHSLIAEAINHLGEIAVCRGEHHNAELLFEQSLKHARTVEDSWRTGWALVNSGKSVLAQGRYGEADERYASAAGVFSEIHNLPGLLNTTRLRGELYEHIGDSLQAIASYRTMQQLATRLGYETIAIAAHHAVAMVLLRLDRRAEARTELAAAREIVAHSNDPWVSDEFRPILDTTAMQSWE